MSAFTESAAALETTDSELVVLQAEPSSRPKKAVLVGQPNVGKSLFFSQLTSRYVTISNFPGTTVEVFRGEAVIEGSRLEILDTPGLNGTTSTSEDERVTLRVLEEETPDLIIQVADAKNLRRTLLLSAQLGNLNIPMILVLNMMDECKEKGISVSSGELSELLGIPVLETVATTGQGFETLKTCLRETPPLPRHVEDPVGWTEAILEEVGVSESRVGKSIATRTTWFTVATLLGAFLHLENYVGPWTGFPTLAGSLEQFFQQVGT
ncbi:MAG: 50S ribosome-binding GTPase, partial [Candidatus Bathyarchaeota archaeon]|nr:50S ribosome-binding GTPase [Candidatus Bathyarchaeota archaeon]